MTLIEILPIALALSMDAFAVSLGAAAAGFAGSRRAVFRLAFHFGLFQFLMPLLGWSLGRTVEPWIADFDHWIAFALLGFVGVRMIRSGSCPAGSGPSDDPSRGLLLVMLATATSIDALAVGLSLAALRISVWYPAVVIGVITAGMCVVAILGARWIRSGLGSWAQIAGGIVLLIVAFRVVISHLAAD